MSITQDEMDSFWAEQASQAKSADPHAERKAIEAALKFYNDNIRRWQNPSATGALIDAARKHLETLPKTVQRYEVVTEFGSGLRSVVQRKTIDEAINQVERLLRDFRPVNVKIVPVEVPA